MRLGGDYLNQQFSAAFDSIGFDARLSSVLLLGKKCLTRVSLVSMSYVFAEISSTGLTLYAFRNAPSAPEECRVEIRQTLFEPISIRHSALPFKNVIDSRAQFSIFTLLLRLAPMVSRFERFALFGPISLRHSTLPFPSAVSILSACLS